MLLKSGSTILGRNRKKNFRGRGVDVKFQNFRCIVFVCRTDRHRSRDKLKICQIFHRKKLHFFHLYRIWVDELRLI